MPRTRRPRSAASRVFFVLLACVLALGGLVGTVLVLDAQRSMRAEAERVTSTAALSIADAPITVEALRDSPNTATDILQPYVTTVVAQAGLSFVTIMTPEGVRVTHPDPAQIGKIYIGTIPPSSRTLTEDSVGTLGPSVRTIVPVLDADDQLIGWVSAGVTTESIGTSVLRRLPASLGFTAALMLAGVAGAWLARRYTRRIAGDLPAGSVRDAVSAYESIRTLSEALRAQTHEHGNRMHTAVALLELGRTQEAIDILVETSRTSQLLVDQVAARREGDPVIGALLLGKSAQASEHGVEWTAVIEPEAPRAALSTIDAVSVLGNLIDNALDAAVGSEDPWVSVHLGASSHGDLVVEVSDSGPGVPDEARDRVFEHGYTTKPAGPDGRGVGLALVRAIVTDAGGTVTIDDRPATFRVVLPPAESTETAK